MEKPEIAANDMLSLIRMHVPHLQTQAQLDLYMTAFNAFTLTFDSLISGDQEQAKTSRQVLDQSLELIPKLNDAAERVAEIPSAEQSAEASKLVSPPKLFTEADEQARLLVELDKLESSGALNNWYQSERGRIDGVVSKQLRDQLFDAIRAKQSRLLS